NGTLRKLCLMPDHDLAEDHPPGRVRLQHAAGADHPAHRHHPGAAGRVVPETLRPARHVLEPHPQGPCLIPRTASDLPIQRPSTAVRPLKKDTPCFSNASTTKTSLRPATSSAVSRRTTPSSSTPAATSRSTSTWPRPTACASRM